MTLYRNASVLQRDMLIAAYLGSGDEAGFNRALVQACGGDAWVERLYPPYELFTASLGALACARHYANKIRDFRLLLLDMHRVLRAFLALSGQDELTAQDRATLQEALGAMVFDARANLRQFGGGLNGEDEGRCPEALARKPGEEARPARDAATAQPQQPEAMFAGPGAATPRPAEREAPPAPRVEDGTRVGDRTPYLSIAAASLFNSVGAFESAVAILAQWTQVPHAAGQLNMSPRNASERALLVWLRLRSVFEIEALLDGKPEFLLNPGYRQMLTAASEQMRDARRNHVIDAFFSDAGRCRGNGDGSLYTQTEQYLHFNYATLRQKYLQTLNRAEAITEMHLKEAERYAGLGVACFHHVAPFADNPKAWIGYFALISAELHARRGASTAARVGRAAAAADLDVARKRYQQAREMLQDSVEQAEKLDAKVQPRPARKIGGEAGGDFDQLEAKLLGGTRVWSLRLDQAKRGEEALDIIKGE